MYSFLFRYIIFVLAHFHNNKSSCDKKKIRLKDGNACNKENNKKKTILNCIQHGIMVVEEMH